MEPAAGYGVAAIGALWEAVTRGRPYSRVLLDARMPDTDGLALAAEIRKRAELSATRIILLSSGDRPGDWDQARQLGISANLLKPLQQRELMETILGVMGHEGEPEGLLISPAVALPPIPEGLVGVPLRILAAEDNDFNRDLLEHMLARLGLSAVMAVNSREALALLEREPFDLLLLDIHMPELDGFQVVGAIRERERTAGGHLPVIALTARSRKEDRERCLQAGMDQCLTKPFTDVDLWAAMDRVLRRDEGRGMKDVEKTDPASSSLLPHPFLCSTRRCCRPPAGATPPCSGRCAGRSSPASQSTWRRSETPCTIRTPCAYAKRLTSSTACFQRSPRSLAIRRPVWKTLRPADCCSALPLRGGSGSGLGLALLFFWVCA